MNAAQKTYLVVAALIRRGDDILLVHQQGEADPDPSWALPGGVVEAGELLTEALAREVREETGLEVKIIGPLIYSMQSVASFKNDQTLAFVFEVAEWAGELRHADPDGLVFHCAFSPLPHAIEKLERLPWRKMREPIAAYLRGEAKAGATWFYREQGEYEAALIAQL